MDDVILISDDEVEILCQVEGHVPFVVDLTDETRSNQGSEADLEEDQKTGWHPEAQPDHVQESGFHAKPDSDAELESSPESQPENQPREGPDLESRADSPILSKQNSVPQAEPKSDPRPESDVASERERSPSPSLSPRQSARHEVDPELRRDLYNQSGSWRKPSPEPCREPPAQPKPEPQPQYPAQQFHEMRQNPLQPHQQPNETKPTPHQRTYPKEAEISEEDLMNSVKELGNSMYRIRRFDEAIRNYKRANELARKTGSTKMSAILHFNLAMCYFQLKSFHQALDECINAVKIDDNYLKAHKKRAEIYITLEMKEEAKICLETLLEQYPNDQDLRAWLIDLQRKPSTARPKDSYQVLGLPYTGFVHEDVKRQYRRKALIHHPDKHSGADTVTKRIQEKNFREISEAYDSICRRYGFSR